MAKMTMNVTVNDPHFQYQLRVFQDACFVQIWWFQLKSVMSYHTDKVMFTYGHKDVLTDGRIDRRTQQKYPFGLKGQGVKMRCLVLNFGPDRD